MAPSYIIVAIATNQVSFLIQREHIVKIASISTSSLQNLRKTKLSNVLNRKLRGSFKK
jgi:hypothetical protein